MSNYQESFMRQLGMIKNQGTSALNDAQNLAELQRQQRERAQAAALQRAQQQAQQKASQLAYQPIGRSGAVGGGVAKGTGQDTFDNFVNAIVGQESGGVYSKVNKDSGALGKYQIMPNNVASWTKAALGKSLTPQQFLASAQAQDATARKQLQNYYNRYGAAGAAVAWYAGESNAQKYIKNPSAYNKPQGAYPSINSYALSVLKKMGLR